MKTTRGTRSAILTLSLLHPCGCGPFVIDVDLSSGNGSAGDESSDDMQGTGPGVTSTSAADGSSHSDGAHSTSDASSDTTSGSSTSELTEGSEGSTGEPVEECTVLDAYLDCDPACALPCAGGFLCIGPAGQEACTLPCGGAMTACPSPEFPPPWETPLCSNVDLPTALCGVPCDAGACPDGYTCTGETCWPL